MSIQADVCASSAPRPANARCSTAARISTPIPRPCADAVSHDPVDTLRLPAKSWALTSCVPTMRPSLTTANGSDQFSAVSVPRIVQKKERNRSSAPGSSIPSVQGIAERHLTGGMDARARRLEELDEILVVRQRAARAAAS